jgi:phage terminase large subunit
LRIFEGCRNLIRCLPSVQCDAKNPEDVANTPHELTHSVDALRYFAAGRPAPGRKPEPPKHYNFELEKPKPRADGYGERIQVI